MQLTALILFNLNTHLIKILISHYLCCVSAHLNETIVAIATAPGQGAIGIVRLSGKDCIAIVDKFFFGKNLIKAPANTIHYGKVKNEDGVMLDECLASVFKAPRSYTKENAIELSCHGSPYILSEIVQLFVRNGARMAKPGEFTMRAFLNGQLDLSQAEAVADLIASENASTHDLALKQLRGGFSNVIQELRQELIDFSALIELELDFGEEDVEFADRGKLESLVLKIKTVIQNLIQSFKYGNVIKNGVSTVIAGRPNAGKSTLLNALLNEERAIVSDIAGTTRDTIEEGLNIRGIKFRLIDTAGIREAQDSIEQLGVEKTKEKINQSTLIVYVFDVTTIKPEELWQDVENFLQTNEELLLRSKQIFVANKMDLNPYAKLEDFYKSGIIDEKNLISASAIHKMNIEALKDLLYKNVIDNPEMLDQTIVVNNRHFEALYNADNSLAKVLTGLKSGISADLIAMDIRQSLYSLGEITGEISSDDLLDSIFSRFCIGK